tara:strand:- start:920 stop:2119 length:1200 start_codon:yes stop_codon:yes gene_type:complete
MIEDNQILKIIERKNHLFQEDIDDNEFFLRNEISSSKFLVIGAAGSIGKSVVKEIFSRNPQSIHLVDINENNLVELVRDLRSHFNSSDSDLKTFCLDCGSNIFEQFFKNQHRYDYILNLSAMKHVRSERDPYTLMRMIETNVLNTNKTIALSKEINPKKYFCVSTDKASNPVSLMGASKRIMEMFLMQESESLNISTSRFANVAFSDGSLLYGFNQRLNNFQPISAPKDIKRYFVTPKESGQLCLMSCLLGENKNIFFPNNSDEVKLINFKKITENFLNFKGFESFECESEDEARRKIKELNSLNKWPCYFFESNTSGEKEYEEFFMEEEKIDLKKFKDIGVIFSSLKYSSDKLNAFLKDLQKIKLKGNWNKLEILNLFKDVIKDLNHIETGKNLDQKM